MVIRARASLRCTPLAEAQLGIYSLAHLLYRCWLPDTLLVLESQAGTLQLTKA